ncbi:MAG: DUF2283 domain-containing protein [Cyanobacteriota bacterium]|nr:DUF2283 domain-containing protein [Cyanobacteriota bacterium]
MEAKYDIEVDVLRINWSQAEIEESDAASPGVIVDYDAEGKAIGIEILNASEKIDNFNPTSSETIPLIINN